MMTKQPVLMRRRASTYITVLGASFLVSLLVLSAMLSHRIQRIRLQNADDLQQARLCAQAALRIGMLRIENNSDWRASYSNGTWESNVEMSSDGGAGVFTLEGIDPEDGDLLDDPGDPFQLTGVGQKGNATQKMSVTLVPTTRGLNCLQAALHAKGNVELKTAVVHADERISSNADILAKRSSVRADVEAAGAIVGGRFYGGRTTGEDSKDLPDVNTLFSYYVARGTPIDIRDIIVPVGVPQTPTRNVLSNPGIENGVSPWVPWQDTSCNFAEERGKVHTGKVSLNVKNRVSFQAGPVQDIADVVRSGSSYHCQAWLRMKAVDVNTRFVIDVNSSDSGSQSWASDTTWCVKDQWTLVAGTISPTFSGTLHSASLRVETPNGEEVKDFLIDDVVMQTIPPAQGENILDNGDMEAGAHQRPSPNWLASPGCLDVHCNGVQAYSGAKSTFVGSRLIPESGALQNISRDLQNGKEYEIEVWTKKSTSGEIRLKPVLVINNRRGETQYISNPWYTNVTHEGWTKVVHRLTPTWSGRIESAYVTWQTSTSTDSFYLDNASVRTVAPPFIPRRTIYRKVLSPNHNPYGSGITNPEGIYVIDCRGLDIHIQSSRIVGTIVLLNPARRSSVRTGPVNWQPAVPNFPALLVDGSFEIHADDSGLVESREQTNFNPLGTPFNGISPSKDTDQNDTYLSRINGIVYVSGNLRFGSHPVLEGVVVCGGKVTVADFLDLTHNPFPAQNPPPGFRDSEHLRVLLDSATKVVDSVPIVAPAGIVD
jgi:hypothetical protein